jgi:hypothetical protein
LSAWVYLQDNELTSGVKRIFGYSFLYFLLSSLYTDLLYGLLNECIGCMYMITIKQLNTDDQLTSHLVYLRYIRHCGTSTPSTLSQERLDSYNA